MVQQPPQSQQPDPRMILALPNPEDSQLQTPYRPQSGDLAASQMNHQASLSVSRKMELPSLSSLPITIRIPSFTVAFKPWTNVLRTHYRDSPTGSRRCR